jgi:hypothetical protein
MKEVVMNYMLLIYQGPSPTTPVTERWNALPQKEQGAIYADYAELNKTPGFTPGLPAGFPEKARTVLVRNGKTEVGWNRRSENWPRPPRTRPSSTGSKDSPTGTMADIPSCVPICPSWKGRSGEVDALTLIYAVDNEDGTRAELVRTTLPAVIDKYLDQIPKSHRLKLRSRTLAAELRALAERIEGRSHAAS